MILKLTVPNLPTATTISILISVTKQKGYDNTQRKELIYWTLVPVNPI